MVWPDGRLNCEVGVRVVGGFWVQTSEGRAAAALQHFNARQSA